MKVREHGIQSREKTRIHKMRPKCNSDGKNFGSVRLIDCHAALFILLYGFMASFLFFCVEKSIKSKLNAIVCSQIKRKIDLNLKSKLNSNKIHKELYD